MPKVRLSLGRNSRCRTLHRDIPFRGRYKPGTFPLQCRTLIKHLDMLCPAPELTKKVPNHPYLQKECIELSQEYMLQ